jgi:hypothetical protein
MNIIFLIKECPVRNLPVRTCLAFAAAAILIAVAPGKSRADFELMIQGFQGGSPIGTMTIIDNMPGDLDPTPGRIFFSNMNLFGAGIEAQISALSNRLNSMPISQVQDATISLQNTSGTPTRIVITVGDTGFTTPGSSGTKMIMASRLGISSVGSPGVTGMFQGFQDNSNAQFGKATGTPSQPFVFPVSDPEEDLLLTRSATYSMTNVFDLNLPGNMILAAGFTGTTELAVVPAPSNLWMLASVFPLMVIGRAVLLRGRRKVAV